MAAKWMTFDEVHTYLGHAKPESTEVWLSRHGIRAVRHYPTRDVIRERAGKRRTKRGAESL